MKTAMIFLLLFLSLNSCVENRQNSNCEIDFEFKSNFQNCIEIMALRNSGYSIDFNHTVSANMCLKILTQHRSPIDTSSDDPLYYPYAEDRNFFAEYLTAWSLWFENNKCRMNMKAADSIFRLSESKYDSVRWPPSLFTILAKEASN